MVHTQRLTLIPVTPELLFAFQLSPELFASMLDVTLPEGWPLFPEAFTPRENETHGAWGGFILVLSKTWQLAGNGGYYGPPDADGNVEIGYEIAPAFRGQGFATEAARALVEGAFQEGAHSVTATTQGGANASNAVARKLGMRFVGDDFDEEAGVVWRYKIWREAVTEVAWSAFIPARSASRRSRRPWTNSPGARRGVR